MIFLISDFYGYHLKYYFVQAFENPLVFINTDIISPVLIRYINIISLAFIH